jgi:PD-(D/E)XK endonuclease
MAKCKGFRNFKERGEWVELQFMVRALRKHFRVLKPWGDSSPYDVAVENGRQFFRVQVKSTSYRVANGYLCGFKPNQTHKSRYTTRKVDFFAALIIPEDVWYILPASVVLKTKSSYLMLCPVRQPESYRFHYEHYREAWKLLRTVSPYK